MSFIVSRKQDIIELRKLEQEARRLGPYGMPPQLVPLTLFTDDPSLERRRCLEVIADASASPDGLALNLNVPIEAAAAIRYVPRSKGQPVHYVFNIEEPAVDIDDLFDADDLDGDIQDWIIGCDERSLEDLLLDFAHPVLPKRFTAAA